jgi:peptidoglycan/LPS O-acetylase OafA/YrhL
MNADADRSNNFDAIRLASALLVLWSHSYIIAGRPQDEIFFSIFSGYDSGGGIAVSIFFVISGYLVTKSAFERPLLDYIYARALRILPAQIFVVACTDLVIGPLLTRLRLIDYFGDPTTREYLWSATIFRMKYILADTTTGLPVNQINGSLWTLPVECGFYILIAIAAKTGLISERTCLYVAAAIIAAHFYATRYAGLSWDQQGGAIWNGATAYAVLTNGSFFAVGAVFWILRTKIRCHGVGALFCLIIWFAAARTLISPIVYFTCLPYLVIYVGRVVDFKIRVTSFVGDLSYGIYLFAFPIQQWLMSTLGPGAGPTTLSLLATPLVVAVAFVSWRMIEKPALGYKRRQPRPLGDGITELR